MHYKLPSLSDSKISKWLISLLVHKLPLWLSGITSSSWLPALSPSSLWLGSSRAFCAFSEVVLLRYLFNVVLSFSVLFFCLALALFWLTLKIFNLCLLAFDSWYLSSYSVTSPRGGFGGLRPPKQSSKPTPNWNMKHNKLVDFLSNLNIKPPRHKRKTFHLTTFWRRFWSFYRKINSYVDWWC